MIRFTDTENPVTLRDIETIECYVGLNFPQEYIDHLLRFNGGRCIPNVFTILVNGKVLRSCIDWFFAIYEGKHDNLRRNVEILKINEKRIPTHMLPIADDPAGNVICISCGTLDFGYIYFWDHENEVDYSESGDDDYSNLYLIARSFSEFLNGLTTLEDI